MSKWCPCEWFHLVLKTNPGTSVAGHSKWGLRPISVGRDNLIGAMISAYVTLYQPNTCNSISHQN